MHKNSAASPGYKAANIEVVEINLQSIVDNMTLHVAPILNFGPELNIF